MNLYDAMATSDYQGATAEGDSGYTFHVTEEEREDGKRAYRLAITKNGMPPHYVEQFDDLGEVLESQPVSQYPWLEWSSLGDDDATNTTKNYEGWYSISVSVSERDAIKECQERGITFRQYGEEVLAHWNQMFPGEEPPIDLVDGIERDLEQVAHAK